MPSVRGSREVVDFPRFLNMTTVYYIQIDSAWHRFFLPVVQSSISWSLGGNIMNLVY